MRVARALGCYHRRPWRLTGLPEEEWIRERAATVIDVTPVHED
jgi:hypothetical protein